MNIVDILVNVPFAVLFLASLLVNVYLYGRLQGLESILATLHIKRTK